MENVDTTKKYKISNDFKLPPRMVDLTGYIVGKLTVNKISYYRNLIKKDHVRKVYYWECECECGNTTYVHSGHLLSNTVKSCGCYVKEINKLTTFKYRTDEITYQEFLRISGVKKVKSFLDKKVSKYLTAIDVVKVVTNTKGKYRPVYTLLCVCGNTIEATHDVLFKCKDTYSCGCKRSRRLVTTQKMVVE